MVAAGTLIYLSLLQGCASRGGGQREKKRLHFSKLNSTNILLSVKADLNTKSIIKEGKGVLNWQPVFTKVNTLGASSGQQQHFCLLEEYKNSEIHFSMNFVKMLK